MSERPPAVKWALRSIAALAVLVAASIGILLSSRGGQAFLAARVLERINGGDVTVAIGGTDGTWPRHMILTDVTISDRQGAWLRADRMELELRVGPLLRGQVYAPHISANAMAFDRLPVSAPQTVPAKPFDPNALLRTLRGLRFDRIEIAALMLGPSLIGRPLDVQLKGSLVPTAEGAKLNAEITERDGTGKLTADLNGDTRALVAKLSGALGNLTATVEGTVTLSGGALQGTAHLTCAAPCRPESDPVVDQATVDLVLGGTVRVPHLEATIAAEGVKLAERPIRSLAATGTVDIADDRQRTLHLETKGTFTDLRAFAPEAAQVVTETAAFTLTGRRAGDTNVIEGLRITSGDAEASATGTLTPDGIAPAHLTMTVKSAGRLGGFGQDRSTTRAELNFVRALKDGTANGDLRVEMTNLSPPPRLAGVVGRDGKLSATFAADAKGLRITDATISSGNLNIKGESLWTGPLAQVVHQASKADLSVVTPSPTGEPTPASASLRLEGPIPNLRAALEVTIPELRLAPDAPAQNLTLTGTATRNGKALEIDVKGAGRWRDQPVELKGQARKGDGPQLTISQLHFASAAAVIDSDLEVDTNTGLLTGKTHADVANIGVLGNVVGLKLKGDGNLDATYAAPGGKQKIDLRLGLRKLEHDAFSADGLTASASIEDAYGTAQIRGRVDSGGGAFLGRPVKSLAITANGPADNAAVTVELTGAARSPLEISIAGRVGLGETTKIALSRFRVHDDTLTAALQGEAQLTSHENEMTLSPTRLAIAGGLVTAELRANRQDDTAAGTITFENIALSAFDAQTSTVAAPSNTIFGGRVTFSSPASATMADVDLTAGFDTGRGKERGQIQIVGRVRDGRAKVTAAAGGFSGEPAKLIADIPANIDLIALKARVDMEKPFTAAINWRGDIGRLWTLIPLDEHVVSGPVVIDASASGTLAAPVVQGGVQLNDGRYENVTQSTVLEHVNASLTAERGNALSFTLAAKDRKNGSLTGKGSVAPDVKGEWIADITTQFRNLLALNRDDITAAVSGELTYKGPLEHGVLAGTLNVQSGEIRIDQIYTVRVPLLRSLENSKQEGASGRTNRRPPPMIGVGLNLDVRIDTPIRIDGRGLDSWWTGRLTIGGNTYAPDFTGQGTVDHGRCQVGRLGGWRVAGLAAELLQRRGLRQPGVLDRQRARAQR